MIQLALEEAHKSAERGEVPIGAVIEKQGKILSLGGNQTEEKKSQAYHAEMVALSQLSSQETIGATIYITHEPCPMCLGAILESGIQKIVFGACEPRWGALKSVVCLAELLEVEVVSGVLLESCQDVIRDFFKKRRLLQKCK